ncbi:hypothetical protein MBLNU459_g8504t1 [Dothideomycetes sp. NU459]
MSASTVGASNKSKTIYVLPAEMIGRVADFLDLKDLRSLRLVCRNISAKTLDCYAKAHFAQLSVPIYRKKSLQRFRYIAQHEVFRAYVGSVTIRVELVDGQRVALDECYCRHSVFAARGPLPQQVAQARAVIKDQFHVLCGASDWTGNMQNLVLLDEIFSMLSHRGQEGRPTPGLTKLQFEAFSLLGPPPKISRAQNPHSTLTGPPKLPQKPTTLSQDNLFWGYYGVPRHDDAWAVLNVLRALAHSSHRLTHLTLGNGWYSVPLEVFSLETSPPGLVKEDHLALARGLENLRYLSLELHTIHMKEQSVYGVEQACRGLATLVSAAEKLDHLELSFSENGKIPLHDPADLAFSTLMRSLYAPALRNLVVDATLAFKTTVLGAFVRKHVSTLTHIGFKHMPEGGIQQLHPSVEALEAHYLLPIIALRLVWEPNTWHSEDLAILRNLDIREGLSNCLKIDAARIGPPIAEGVYEIYSILTRHDG